MNFQVNKPGEKATDFDFVFEGRHQFITHEDRHPTHIILHMRDYAELMNGNRKSYVEITTNNETTIFDMVVLRSNDVKPGTIHIF